MQQASETATPANESAAGAPIPSVDALDTSNLVTDAAAAARKCPECEALMEVEKQDESGHHDEEDDGPWKPLLRCTNPDCAHVIDLELDPLSAPAPVVAPAAAAAAPEAVTREVRCETCGLQLVIEPLSSGHGFKVIAGASPDQTFGVSANGFPVCPTDGVALIPVGPIPVAEAFKAVQGALQDQAEDRRLPFPAPSFNAERALHAIFRQNAAVEVKRRRHEDLKAKASTAKKELDDDEQLLGKMISEYARNEQDAIEAASGKLRPGQASVCAYEQRTGQPCHICREARKKAKEAGSNEPHDRLVSVEQHLERRGFFIGAFIGNTEPLLAIQRDTPELFAALERWAHDETVTLANATALSELVNRACIAGPHGEAGQHCTRCGAVLVSKQDEGEALTPYPEGAAVGLDCTSPLDAEAAKPEPARQPRRRHKTPADAAAAKTKAAKAERQEKPKTAPAKGEKKRTRSRS